MNVHRGKNFDHARHATKDRAPACYRCSMPAVFYCEFVSCRIPMCAKHRIKKAGGSLCDRHQDARLVQDSAVRNPKFKDAGVAVPHHESDE